jgi:hypothetical protein
MKVIGFQTAQRAKPREMTRLLELGCWIVRRIGGRKSHPELHRVLLTEGLLPVLSDKIKREDCNAEMQGRNA